MGGGGGSTFWKTREIGLPSYNDLSTGHPLKFPSRGNLARFDHFPPASREGFPVKLMFLYVSLFSGKDDRQGQWTPSTSGQAYQYDTLLKKTLAD
jgi:hypothetical protein